MLYRRGEKVDVTWILLIDKNGEGMIQFDE